MNRTVWSRVSAVFFLFLAFLSLAASDQPVKKSAASLEPIEQSAAFQEYMQKPKNNLSKLIFGLNYFRTAPVLIQYDDVEYSPQFAYPLGLAYLLTHYHDEKPEQWIKKNCYRSPTANKVIYFKFSDGKYRPARDVFLETYSALEKAERQKTGQPG